MVDNNKIPDIILANQSVMAGIEKENGRTIKAMVTFSTLSEDFNFAAFRYKTMRQILHNLPATEERLLTLDNFLDNTDKTISAGPYKKRFLVKQGQRL